MCCPGNQTPQSYWGLIDQQVCTAEPSLYELHKLKNLLLISCYHISEDTLRDLVEFICDFQHPIKPYQYMRHRLLHYHSRCAERRYISLIPVYYLSRLHA